MITLVDLTYIHSREKLNESVALYAFRLLRSFIHSEREKITLLVVPEMEKDILERTGEFKTLHFHDINKFFLKIPYLKGFLRKRNWEKQLKNLTPDKFNNIYLPFCWSGNSGKINLPKIVTVHDLRPMREASRAFTDTLFFQKLGLKKIYLHAIKKYYTAHMQNALKVIAISKYVADDLKSEWPEYSAKVNTIYNSVSKSGIEAIEVKEVEKSKFILYVNTLSKYKNIETLIKAFSLFKDNPQNKEVKLVIVGKETPYWKNEVKPIINNLDLCTAIVHITYAQKEELIWLYQNAKVFVTPSIHEGFGYTPIEAAMEGCPVISSRCESLPDVTAERVRYYDPPTDHEALYKVIIDEFSSPTSENDLSEISHFFTERYSPLTHKKKILCIINQV